MKGFVLVVELNVECLCVCVCVCVFVSCLFLYWRERVHLLSLSSLNRHSTECRLSSLVAVIAGFSCVLCLLDSWICSVRSVLLAACSS